MMILQKGLTLIEMMIVIAIVLILTAVGILNYDKNKASDAVATSYQVLKSDLVSAKDTASGSAGGAEIDFNAGANGSYTLVIQAVSTTGAKSVVHQDSLFPGVNLATSWGSSYIDFQQNGQVTNFANTGTITLSDSGTALTKQIQIIPHTGAILP
jgi:prepilin-type N-terminal cleavage/methylation domain-containing protein